MTRNKPAIIMPGINYHPTPITTNTHTLWWGLRHFKILQMCLYVKLEIPYVFHSRGPGIKVSSCTTFHNKILLCSTY